MLLGDVFPASGKVTLPLEKSHVVTCTSEGPRDSGLPRNNWKVRESRPGQHSELWVQGWRGGGSSSHPLPVFPWHLLPSIPCSGILPNGWALATKTEVYVMSTSSRVDPWIFPALTPPCFFFFHCLGAEEHGHLDCHVLERVESQEGRGLGPRFTPWRGSQ